MSRNNEVIRASAGTGKTYQLSNRFLGLVAAGVALDTILATTFTRKAAGEILARILLRLAESADDPDKLAELAKSIQMPLDRPQCLALLAGMVRRLHRLRVSTLDSFFLVVARSFSLELGLPPGWRIVDEVDDKRLRAEAIRAVLQEHSTGDVHRLMQLLSKGQAARSVSRQIAELVERLYAHYLESSAAAWDSLGRRKPLEDAAVLCAIEALAAVELPPDSRFKKAHDAALENARNCNWDTFVTKGLAAKIVEAAGDPRFCGKVIPAYVCDAYRPLIDHARAEILGQIASQTEATRRLLGHFDTAYRALKLTRRALRFEDVTRLVGEWAEKKGTGPIGEKSQKRASHELDVSPFSLDDLAHRLDGHVSHLLLDEFQDTSPSQWRVLRPFAKRSAGAGDVGRGVGDKDSGFRVQGSGPSDHRLQTGISERAATESPEPRTLNPEPSPVPLPLSPRRSFFCVGDVKQAIYGWRGGEAEIFDAIQSELPGLAEACLDTSYRSSLTVIDTVNRVFQNLADNAVLRQDNCLPAAAAWTKRFHRHSTVKLRVLGHCRMIAARQAEPSQEQEGQAVVTCRIAAEEIARLHREAPGFSIGVLVRRNATVARLIYELRNQHVEASEEGGNPLSDSPAVELILSLLTLADHPGHTAARFHVARSPLGPLLELDRHNDDGAACRLARDLRRRLVDEGYGPTIAILVSQLAPHCEQRDQSRLVQLVEMAHAYEPSATLRAGDFVTKVRSTRVESPRGGAVRVMTVHQAKGLQFDIVVLPELDVRLTGQPPQVVVSRPGPAQPIDRVLRYVAKGLRPLLPMPLREMFDEHDRRIVEEALCVFYVAMTRAVYALHMIVAPSPENERSLPATFAGVLRAALTDGRRLEAGSLAYESGDAEWWRSTKAENGKRKADDGELTTERSQVFCDRSAFRFPPSARPRRGLERRSPSQLEGGAMVSLAQRLQLDTGQSLQRGTLIHAWFEQIEWLDDGDPDEKTLRDVAATLVSPGLDVSSLLGQFRRALAAPAIHTALSRSSYEGRGVRKEVWREKRFVLREEDAILSGSIDRLVAIYDGARAVGADVLDFKTDVLPAGDGAAVSARIEFYRPQLAAYRRAAARLLGLEPDRVSARLVFTELGQVYAL